MTLHGGWFDAGELLGADQPAASDLDVAAALSAARDLTTSDSSPYGEPDRDPCEPGSERAVAAPAGKRAVGGHERLLGDILGLLQVAEDPVARADDRRPFAIDELSKGLAIPVEHGTHGQALIVIA